MLDQDQLIKPVGAPPETLILSGERRVETTVLKWSCYDKDSCETTILKDLSEVGELDITKRYWLDLAGLHDGALVGAICQQFGVNKMVGEDVMNTHSLAKVEDFDGYIYISQKVPFLDADGDLEVHQMSLIMLKNVVITFTEDDGDFFAPIYKRVNVAGSRMARRGPDYLTWALMDLGVDQTLSYLRQLDKSLEDVEDLIMNSKSLPDLTEVHVARSEVTRLYRDLRPFKGVVHHLYSSDTKLIKKSTKVYINDLLDHVGFAIETTEFLREQGGSLRELYFTTTSHRMNEVMKLLAIVSAIFMPLSFLAGMYGMNFVNIPELNNEYGYYILLSVFFLLASSLIVLFKKRGWF
ncbi:MAG: magnesium/cobalt transporter CorA [Akkermansiaceae bacterium]